MSYSQALEEQVRLLRFMEQEGPSYMAATAHARGASQKAADLVQTMIESTLRVAEPFYWSPEMCDVLASVSEDMPTWTLRHTDLLVTSGFMHFAKPLALPPLRDGSTAAPLSAIGWTIGQPNEDGQSQIIVSLFTYIASRSYPFVAVPFWDGENMVSFLDEVGKQTRPSDQDTLEASVRYIGAALALCRQQIISTPSQRAERSTRKRAADLFAHEPLIRVVQLRRASTGQSADATGRSVEWSCRWVVSGHWRQQYYPSSDDHKPIWVLPYVKGPESAPLKAPRAKVFEVVR